MPIKTKRDEEKWEKAKEIAAGAGKKALSGIFQDVKKFIARQRTWLELEEESRTSLYFSTRDNGDVGSERPGREDLREARRLALLVNKEFAGQVKASFDYVDEWTNLDVALVSTRASTTQKSVPHPTLDTFTQSSKARWVVIYPSGKMMETVAERLPGGWNTWMVASGKPMPKKVKNRLLSDAEMLKLFLGAGPVTPGQSLTVEVASKPLLPLDQITSFLRRLKTRTGGGMRDVDFYSESYGPSWSVEPAWRQRLDHFGNEGEGWDEDGWEEDYAGPLRQEVQEKLDREFGSGVLEVEVGEKGHVEVSPGSQAKTKYKFAGAVGPYEDSEITGVKVTQVQTDNRRSKASIRSNKLLIQWGMDAPVGSPMRTKYLPKWVNWAKKKLGQKAERVEMKKEWTRTVVDGYSVYDLENKEQVAAILTKIQRDVQPILREFGLKFMSLKESVAEGSLGFNRDKRIIALNVRQKRNPMLLRKYSAIMSTMIHEMAHLRHMNHGRGFQEFEVELMQWARDKKIYSPGRAASRVALRYLLRQGNRQDAEALYGFKGAAKVPQEVKDQVIALLKKYKGKEVPDSEVHAIAEKAGISPHDLESYIYSLASAHVSEKDAAEWKDKIPGGKADKKKPSDFDPETIAKGIKVELEHTDDPELAKEIVLDHLTEFEDYYEALDKMEKELEGAGE